MGYTFIIFTYLFSFNFIIPSSKISSTGIQFCILRFFIFFTSYFYFLYFDFTMLFIVCQEKLIDLVRHNSNMYTYFPLFSIFFKCPLIPICLKIFKNIFFLYIIFVLGHNIIVRLIMVERRVIIDFCKFIIIRAKI